MRKRVTFSEELKSELSGLPIDECTIKGELLGLVKGKGSVLIKNNKKYLRIYFYNLFSTKRFYKIVNHIWNKHFSISTERHLRLPDNKTYTIDIDLSDTDILRYLQIGIFDTTIKSWMRSEGCVQGFSRGLFISSGSISDPMRSYHLEIINSNSQDADFARSLLPPYFKTINRRNKTILYLKNSENIIDFLKILGVKRSLEKILKIKGIKAIRSLSERKTNMDSANTDRISEASSKYINCIMKLKKMDKYDSLPDSVKEVADVRLKNPGANMDEIGITQADTLNSSLPHEIREKDGDIQKNFNERYGIDMKEIFEADGKIFTIIIP